ncbi:hypothetical protein ABPG72_013707 [Tetrahymena utriculariae]
MKQIVIKHLFLALLLEVVNNQCPTVKSLITSLTYFSCEQMQMNQQERGVFVLYDEASNFSQITFVGWYKLIGKSNLNYLLFEARNSPSQNLIKVTYNPIKMLIYCQILGNNLATQDISSYFTTQLSDNWFFMRVGINLQDQNTLKSFIYFIITTSTTPITQYLNNPAPFKEFNKYSFELFYGLQAYYPYSRSCSISKQVLALLGLSNNSDQGVFQATLSTEMYLLSSQILYFNFAMFSQKYHIFNLVPNSKQSFYIEAIKTDSPPYQFLMDLVILIPLLSLIQKIQMAFCLLLTYELLILEVHMVLLCFQVYGQLKAQLLNYPTPITKQQGIIATNGQFLIEIRYFKFYFGGFSKQCDICNLFIDSIGDCLLCEKPYLLQQSQQFTCKSACESPLYVNTGIGCSFITGLNVCQYPFQERFFDLDCSCPQGQYFDGNYCKNCQNYCKTCNSANSCIDFLSDNYQGFCDESSFNDGRQCIQSYLKITNRQNQQFQIDNSKIMCVKGFQLQNLDGIQLIVKLKYEQIAFYQVNIKNIIKINLNDPYFVFANVSPLFQHDYPFCGNIGSNNWIFEGDQSMRVFQNLLQTFSQNDPSILVDFSFPEYSNPNNLILVNKSDPSININFKSIFNIDKEKGLCISLNEGSLQNINLYLQKSPYIILLSFYFTNSFQEYYQNFFEFTYGDSLLILLRIRSFFSFENLYYLDICTKDLDCRIAYKIPFQNDSPIHLQELQMSFPFITNIYPSYYNIKLSSQNKDIGSPSTICYSQLQIYVGGFYFINYENKDPCFIYINRSNMQCIYPKQNYGLKDGIAIPNTDCNSYNQDNKNQPLYFYNKYNFKCQSTGIAIPNCQEINTQTNKCNKCSDNNFMDQFNNCQCPFGMFIDQNTQKCKYCSPQCKTCENSSDNCIECKGIMQIPPQCNCESQNLYKDDQYNCRNCDAQCSSCLEKSSNCITCSERRSNPPFCECDKNLYYTVNNTCQIKICPFQCQTCDENLQCIKCRGDRIQPPQCLCPEGLYENPAQQIEFCQKCSTGFYLDSSKKQCFKCFELCQTCSGATISNCKTCLYNLQLNQQNECVCPQGKKLVKEQVNQFVCYYFMQAKFKTQIENNQLQVIIKFQYQIDNLLEILNQQGIQNLFSLSISQIDSSLYGIQSYSVQNLNQQLTLDIRILQNIQSATGFLIFKKTEMFKNQIYKYILNPIYSEKPYQFAIGPFYLNTTYFVNLQFFLPQNEILIDIINKCQFVFYILNSLQPTSMFLLLNMQMPPNLYQYFYQFGKLVYRNVPSTQYGNINNDFTLFEYDLSEQVQQSQKQQLARLGFSNSILVNCQIILVKYAIIIFLIASIQLYQFAAKCKKFEKVKVFFIKRLNIENEINLLIIVLSICAQFCEILQDDYFWRMSFYTAIFMGFTLIFSSALFFKIYNSKQFLQNKQILEIFYERLKEEQFKYVWINKNFYFLNAIKKIIIIIILYIFSDYPKMACYLACVLNITSGLFTLYLRPYKYIFTSLIKGVGDLLLVSVWIIVILIANFNQQFSQEVILNTNDFLNYLRLGFTASILLTVFNGIFFINFILEQILLPLQQKISSMFQRRQQI